MTTRGTVLIGEDDPDQRRFFRGVLEGQGYEVVEAADGDEVLAAIRKGEPPSLIALDLMLPGRTGWGVVAELRRDPDLADVPVLLVTGRADEEFRERASELGLAGYVVKPVREREYANAVQRAMRRPDDVWD